MPTNVREKHLENMKESGEQLDTVIEEFKSYILPYGSGNIHPGFMGWVQGGFWTILNSNDSNNRNPHSIN